MFVHFYIEGKRVQGIGYRAHLAMLALTSGVERLYAKNLPPAKGIQKVAVYAGARSRKTIALFYQSVKEEIPENAIDVHITNLEPYNSKIIVPPVMHFVSTLTAGELEKGISAIGGVKEEAGRGLNALSKDVRSLSKDVRKGFKNLPSKLTESLVKGLAPKFGQSIVDSLIEAGMIEKKKEAKQRKQA